MNIAIGAQMYTLRAYTQTAQGLDEALGQVKGMGYDYVQLSGQSADIDPSAIRDMLDKHGLKAPTTHISFDLMQNDFQNVVKTHRIWGAQYPGVGSMPPSYSGAGAEGFRRFAKDASEVAKKFQDEGMTFIYHNHDFEFVNYGGTTGYQILIEESDPALQMEMDTYWVQAGGGDPVRWIQALRGRMDVIHFKDMEIVPWSDGPRKVRQVFCEIGQGNLNWEAIFRACDETGVKYAFVEQDETRRDSAFTSLAMSREFLTGNGFA